MALSEAEKTILRNQIRQHKANRKQALEDGYLETARVIQGHIDIKEERLSNG